MGFEQHRKECQEKLGKQWGFADSRRTRSTRRASCSPKGFRSIVHVVNARGEVCADSCSGTDVINFR